jgi:RNA polymerase sigma factor (sigma-70 family)
MSGKTDFEALVDLHYPALFRFAFSLSSNENDAGDLTQETFHVWARKGHQLRDISKAKTWLFTTLHRLYLEKRRRMIRFPHHDLEEAAAEIPPADPVLGTLDAAELHRALALLPPDYQAAVCLFYLDEHSYPEIAEILQIPVGTVKSRISRGIVRLQTRLTRRDDEIVPRKSS